MTEQKKPKISILTTTIQRFALILSLLLLHVAHSATAQEFSIATNLVTEPSQTISQERWTMADSSDIQGTYENDFFLVGRTARISAAFDMDFFCAANDINYTGTSKGHVRLAGNAVVFNGEAGDNVICLATTAEIGSEAKLGRNAVLAGQTIIVNGKIAGDLKIYAAQATLGGKIDGNVLIVADNIILMPGTTIGGDLEYMNGKDEELFLNQRISIGGECIQRAITDLPQKKTSVMSQLATQAYFYMNALMVGALIIFLFPRFTTHVIALVKASVLKCFLTGLIALVALPLIAFVLLVSMIGIPVSVLLIFVYGIILYSSKIYVAYFVGLFVFKRHIAAGGPNRFFTILSTGLIIIYALALIPALSLFIWLLATCIGSGAMLLALSRIRQERQIVIKLPDDAQPPLPDSPQEPPQPPPSDD